MHKDETLQRSMGVTAGISLVVGTVIGSGIFFKQAQVLTTAGGTTAALMAWIVGGVITLAGGLTISEIGAKIPLTGGLYVYIEQIYGKVWGFLTGWTQTVLYGPAIVASLSAYFAILFNNFFGLTATWNIPVAIGVILMITAINLLDNRVPAGFAVLTTSVKLLPILVVIIYGLFFGHVSALHQTVATASNQASGGFGMAVLATLFAYDGWATLTNMGGELKNPQKNLPRAIVGGILIVVLAYVGISYGMMRALPANEIVRLGDNATFGVITKAFGNIGGRLLTLAILISILGTLNGKLMALPRMTFAMAEHGVLPKWLAKMNRFNEPIGSILFLTVTGILLQFTASADWLSNIAVFVIWIFYTAVFVGLFILRYREQHNKKSTNEQQHNFVVPGYPIVPFIAIAGALFVLMSSLMDDFVSSLLSILFVLLGLPVYWYYQKKGDVNE
ncbi:APA family basic amino acid/polyamine antiporter [Weissella uvarum]|uniref:APC family permease n=1 Tax=Weissella uvarum TaxID=1479233 RepID=UPI00195F4FBA|nr:amino acid permease [Weissella uvarum]MBM7616893.1 APA family basic amino acid/polyamine antiporter [Weissella uvarum]MCM0594655.1 amino acid permease [Weissella uvarum]